MVSTAGSNALTVRVIIDCSARTISHATGTGSVAQCGDGAWSAPAGHDHLHHVGRGQSRTRAVDDEVGEHVGSDVQGERGVDAVEDAFVDHVGRPAEALLTGLEHEPDRPPADRAGRPARSQPPTSIAVWASWPGVHRSVDDRREVQTRVLGMGRASMSPQQDRRAVAGAADEIRDHRAQRCRC